MTKKYIKKSCKLDECDKGVQNKEYCSRHYRQIVLGLEIREARKKVPTKCVINNCEKMSICKNMCSMHYERVKKHGCPHTVYKGGGSSKTKIDMPSEFKYRLSNDEKECLNDLFTEKVGRNEGENVYCYE